MPSYKTNDPKGWGGDPRRGAALGRRSRNGDPTYGGTILVRQIQVDREGYDPLGTYWGTGAPLYWYASNDDTIEGTLRADTAEFAVAKVSREYPRATVRAGFRDEDAIDHCLDAYIEAALWSTLAEDAGGDREDGEFLDSKFSIKDLTPESHSAAEADCRSFLIEAESLIGANVARAGHCLWLDRNGHGTGFQDGDWSEEAGKALAELARRMGPASIEVGDDGRLYYDGTAKWREYVTDEEG